MTKCPLSLLLVNIFLDVLASAVRKKANKKDVKSSLFVDDMIIILLYIYETQTIPPENIYKYLNIRIQTAIQKLVAFFIC